LTLSQKTDITSTKGNYQDEFSFTLVFGLINYA